MTNKINLIADQSALSAFCKNIAGSEYITVDTEFLRESTFWPKLCLVQVATPNYSGIIDPLANNIDLKPLLDIMADPSVKKVFHAGRQDMEIFYRLMKRTPTPVFDTQIAAMVCGYGDQIGYDKLVAAITHHKIDKGTRFTNWAERPLSQEQLVYALSDVTHLCKVYEHLQKMLSSTGRSNWASEELQSLVDPSTYEIDPDNAWKRLKARTDKPRFLSILKSAAAWRERESMRRDQPRNWVMRDEALLNIAAQAPKDANALARCRGLPKGFINSRPGQDLLAQVSMAAELPASQAPKPEPRRQLDPELAPTVELLKVILKRSAEEHGVAQRLIASAEDLESIASGQDSKALSGWRNDIFGADAQKLIRGELGLAISKNKVRIFKIASNQALAE